MEMEMRATEDIEMAEDITPPLPPLTSALHDSFLLTHCSSCFSPFPNPPIPNSNPLRYCSPKCSDSDSLSADHLPFSDTADLRASLRLLHLVLSDPSAWCSAPPERIFGLLTNREKLMLAEDDSDVFVKIRKGADAMASSSTRTNSPDIWDGTALEEAVLCLVLTNAVDVQDSIGRTIGIAVYHSTFCWINHSCSPNACYRFETPSDSINTRLRIAPSCTDLVTAEMGTVRSNLSNFIRKGLWSKSYG